MTLRRSLLALTACSLTAGTAAAQGSFEILGAGLTPSGVSADGEVVVGDTGGQFFEWTAAGGLNVIGGTAAGAGGAGDASVSWDGSTVTATRANDVTGLLEMQRYDRATATWSSVGNLGASSGNSTGSGWSTSGDGRSSVGLGWVTAGSAHAIQWDPVNGLVDLGSTVPNRSSRANDCDFDGNVVVGWQDQATGTRQGAVWIDGVQQTISLGASAMGELGCVSGDGTWAGGIGNFSNGGEAYLWSEATGVINLGHLNPTFSGGTTGVSADGVRAVGFDRPFGPAILGRGFLWEASFGMVDLNDVASSVGIDTQGVTLSLPLAISPDGRTIVGAGLGPGGSQGWRLTLPEQDCGFAGYGYGAGVTNGLVLAGDGPLTGGSLADFSVDNAFGDVGLLAFSNASAEVPLLGVTALVDAGSLVGLFDMVPVAGSAVFSAPISASAASAGLVLFAQAFAIEPANPGLLAASNGLKVTLCP